MRIRILLIALALLTFGATAVPGVEAAKEPVGDCDSGAIVEYCSVYCINPPCTPYVCTNTVERICTAG